MTSSPPQSALKSTHRCPSGGQRPNRPLGLACDLAPSPGWTCWLRPPHAARGRPRASKSPPGRGDVWAAQVHGQGEDVSLLLRIQATERDRGRIGTSRAIRAGWGGAVRGRPRPTARPSLQEQVPAPIFRPFFVSFPSASWISAPPCFTPRPWTQRPCRRQPALPRAPAPFQLAASRLCSKRPRITRPLTGTVRALSPPPRGRVS